MIRTLKSNYMKSNNVSAEEADAIVRDTLYKPTSIMYSTLMECSYSKDFKMCVENKFKIPKDLNLLKIKSMTTKYKEEIERLQTLVNEGGESRPADIAVSTRALLEELAETLRLPDLQNLISKYPLYANELSALQNYQQAVNKHIANLTETDVSLKREIESMTRKLAQSDSNVKSLTARLDNAQVLQHDQIAPVQQQLDAEKAAKLDLQNRLQELQQKYDDLAHEAQSNNEQLIAAEKKYQEQLNKMEQNLVSVTRDLTEMRKVQPQSQAFRSQYLKFLDNLARSLGQRMIDLVQEYANDSAATPESAQQAANTILETVNSLALQNRDLHIETQKLAANIKRHEDARVTKNETESNWVQQHNIASGLQSENDRLKKKLLELEKVMIEYDRIKSLAEIKGSPIETINSETKTLQAVKNIIQNFKSLNENRSLLIDRITKLNIIFRASFAACRNLYKLATQSSEPVKSQILDILKPLSTLYVSNGVDDFMDKLKPSLISYHKINETQLFSPSLSKSLLEYTQSPAENESEESSSESSSEEDNDDDEKMSDVQEEDDIFAPEKDYYDSEMATDQETTEQENSETEATPRPVIVKPSLSAPDFMSIANDDILQTSDEAERIQKLDQVRHQNIQRIDDLLQEYKDRASLLDKEQNKMVNKIAELLPKGVSIRRYQMLPSERTKVYNDSSSEDKRKLTSLNKKYKENATMLARISAQSKAVRTMQSKLQKELGQDYNNKQESQA